MEVCGVEVYRISLVEDYLLILENDSNCTLEHKIELLSCVAYELCGLIRGFECNKKRLHHLIGITESKILEAVTRITADTSALAAADDLESVDTAGFACDELIEIDSEFV